VVLPKIREPMAATQIAKPLHRPGWIHEEKVDAWRVLAYKDAAGVRLVSRNAKDLTIQSARQRDCCAHISTRRRRRKSAEYLA